jgi:hypothetical protein
MKNYLKKESYRPSMWISNFSKGEIQSMIVPICHNFSVIPDSECHIQNEHKGPLQNGSM